MLNDQNTGSAGGPQSAPVSPQVRTAPVLVSRRAYAKLRGVDDKTIRKAIQAGKIPLVDGLIDPAIADAAWSRNRDAGQESKLADAASGVPAEPLHASAKPEPRDPQPEPREAQPEFELAPLTEARIANTKESTAIKEITRRKLEGGLLEAEEVERTWGELLQMVKDRLRMMPDNLGPALAACSEEAECRSLVMREVMEALGALSKDVAGMVA